MIHFCCYHSSRGSVPNIYNWISFIVFNSLVHVMPMVVSNKLNHTVLLVSLYSSPVTRRPPSLVKHHETINVHLNSKAQPNSSSFKLMILVGASLQKGRGGGGGVLSMLMFSQIFYCLLIYHLLCRYCRPGLQAPTPSQHYGSYGNTFHQNVYNVQAWQVSCANFEREKRNRQKERRKKE